LAKAIAASVASVAITTAEATAKEGAFTWQRWIGRDERKRLSVRGHGRHSGKRVHETGMIQGNVAAAN